MQDEFQQIGLQLIIFINLGGRNTDPFLKDFPSIGWEAAWDLAPYVSHVSKHSGIGN